MELQLCRDVYHCRPSELDEEDAERLGTHITIMSAEGFVGRFKASFSGKKPPGKGRRR